MKYVLGVFFVVFVAVVALVAVAYNVLRQSDGVEF